MLLQLDQPFLDALNTSILILDDNLSVRYLNESAEILIDDSKTRVYGRNIDSVIHQPLPSENVASIKHACCKSLKQESQIRLHDIDISFPVAKHSKKVDCYIHTLWIDGQKRVCIEIYDRYPVYANGSTSEHYASRQNIIRGLAHEIRNPLGGIKGAAQLLSSELDEPDQREFTDIIIHEADRLSRLVSQMQASAVMKSFQSINIHRVLEHVRILIESELGDDWAIETDYDPSLPDILGDQDRLIQAILNIVRNAVIAVSKTDHLPGIIFRTRIDHHILTSLIQQQVIRIDIKDNGCGIESEILQYIFEPMVSDHPSGSGLGLSITSDIVHAHGGVITAKSEDGETVISLFFPLAERLRVNGGE